MTIDMNYFRAIQNATGAKTTQDIEIAETKREFNDGFETSIGIKRDVKIGERLQDFIITITELGDVCHMFSRPNETFGIGELLEYESGYWLVVEKNIENGIFSRGKIQKCNHLLIWQNTETYEIIERWSIAKDPYTSGEDRTAVVTTGSGKYKIQLPYDDETKLLRRDKRFLMGLFPGSYIPYRLVRFDDITNTLRENNGGFLVINVDEDVEQHDNDNQELGIADYKVPPIPQPDPTGNIIITQLGRPELRVGGNAKTFKAVFTDDNGNVISTIIPNWNIDISPDLRDRIDISYDVDNNIKLKALNWDESIGQKFTLIVNADDITYGFFEAKIEIALISLF